MGEKNGGEGEGLRKGWIIQHPEENHQAIKAQMAEFIRPSSPSVGKKRPLGTRQEISRQAVFVMN